MSTHTPVRWTTYPIGQRRNFFFFSAVFPDGQRANVLRCSSSMRWYVQLSGKILPSTWPTSAHARRYARLCFDAGATSAELTDKKS